VTAPLIVYGAALRRAAAGTDAPLHVVDSAGQSRGRLDTSRWAGDLVPGDGSLLQRCFGTTLDVGCGPGRLAAALTRSGIVSVGVDVSPEAVRLARRRGAIALRRNVFDPIPREGSWHCILLADGNIGIGGDPERLLRRCATLLGSSGAVLAEIGPPGEPGWRAQVVLRDEDRQSAPFPWATVATHEIKALARRTAYDVKRVWTEAGRWFVHLSKH
jgi:SAM-dependent methyltransferase